MQFFLPYFAKGPEVNDPIAAPSEQIDVIRLLHVSLSAGEISKTKMKSTMSELKTPTE